MYRLSLIGVFAVFFLLFFAINSGHGEVLRLDVIVVTPTPEPPSGGGGGGGGGTSTARVAFSGYAYSNAVIHILKDGVEVRTISANSSGEFAVVVNGLNSGTFNFGFWATDIFNRRSVTLSFPLNLIRGSTTSISNIIIPPIIELSDNTISSGDSVTAFGSTTPDNKVHTFLEANFSTFSKEFVSGASNDGLYSVTILTQGLTSGLYTVKSQTEILENGIISISSQLAPLGVGVPIPTQCSNEPDINGDSRISLIDFSIMAFWWKKSLPTDSPVDLNCDGALTLADFSILAFNWTG